MGGRQVVLPGKCLWLVRSKGVVPFRIAKGSGRHVGQFEQGKDFSASRERPPFGQKGDYVFDFLLGQVGVGSAVQFATEDDRMQRQVLLGIIYHPQIIAYLFAKGGALHLFGPFDLHAEENSPATEKS